MIKAGILGTGNIGTDLLLKIIKTDFIKPVIFPITDQGIKYFIDNPNCCDVVYDCTSAADARDHAKVFKKQGIKVIDLTPSKIGDMCVPDVNSEIIITDDNINMITCGGQASMPMLHLISKECKGIEYVEVVSQIASKSAGMATRINIDNYIYTTQKAITKFTGCTNCKVILNLNPAEPCVDMQTTIFIKTKNINFENLTEKVLDKIEELKQYIPYYELVLPPTMNENGVVVLSIRVKGIGDYLPSYAGNLDIINCAAIKITEKLIQK